MVLSSLQKKNQNISEIKKLSQVDAAYKEQKKLNIG